MEITYSKVLNILIIKLKKLSDKRGFFCVNYIQQYLNHFNIPQFVQESHSRSCKNVLRGLHYQLPTAQGKFIRVIQGVVQDIIVDIRKNSPTFGQYESFILGDDNDQIIYIPPGFAHGFLTLSNTADFLYSLTNIYSPKDEKFIIWSDPDLNIDWRVKENLLISPKDLQAKRFKDLTDDELFIY